MLFLGGVLIPCGLLRGLLPRHTNMASKNKIWLPAGSGQD